MSEYDALKDKWNNLWEWWDSGKVDPFALETCFPDWIKKVKAEGDSLKEKADKYDKYSIYLIEIETKGVWGVINELEQKLESVREIAPELISTYEALEYEGTRTKENEEIRLRVIKVITGVLNK